MKISRALITPVSPADAEVGQIRRTSEHHVVSENNGGRLRRRSVRSAVRWCGEVTFYIVLAGAPLPFGSDEPSSVALWCLLLGAGLILLALSTRRLSGRQVAALFAVLGIVCCYGFVLHEQLADRPWIAPYDPIWSQAAILLESTIHPSASIVRGEPLFALGPSMANVLALVCGVLVGTEETAALRALKVFGWAGVAYAAYGLFSFFFEPTQILWREKNAYLGSLTGTFINRNTAAAYFGSSALLWLCVLMRQIRHHLGAKIGSWRTVPSRIFIGLPKEAAISFGVWFVCLAAMFLTGSRAGVAVSLFAMAAVSTVYFRNDVPKRYGLVIFAVSAALAALLLLQFMGGVVSNRFDIQGLADEGRLSAYASTWKMILDHPWFGTGLGTFRWGFAAYRSSEISMQGVWDIAHNTPLELAAEMGLPLAALVCVSWLVLLGQLVTGARVGGRGGLIALAALGISVIGILHSLVDFTLQIPGYSIGAFALAGVALSRLRVKNVV